MPAVHADYTPQGTTQHYGGMECYVTGPADASKAILGVYDIFGPWASTYLGADLLAAHTAMRVVLPDFFRGDPLAPETLPADTPAKQERFRTFLLSLGEFTHIASELLDVAAALQQQGVTTLGVYGLCWGSKPCGIACGDGTPFQALVQIHPSFIDPDDALKLRVPMALFPSRDDETPKLDAYVDRVLHNPAIGKASIVHHYPQHHGFAGARAQLGDAANRAAFQDVYERAANFFVQHMQRP
ncbi:hypothetical protein MVES_001312 [Malassezia vespertilionis]|uniref:Dienelactone hydrolase domain-containing protein n=1 Tax=Malassezia vespertilionis TaxID=2020962 RepID=A0A2N1JDQ5_9BASI|nr:hypothetical protein MVES_001312 [Malassezia vespertilionis]